MNEQELSLDAWKIRRGIIESTYAAKSGHPGGSLGSAEIFSYLYFQEMNIDPKNPQKKDRDRFVLSKGHCAPGLYATLALKGFFPWEDLKTLRHIGSHLQGHPSMRLTPGVDMSTGSLGQGVSAACGMALASKITGEKNRVYTLLGDGELGEGECWEAFMYASHHKLDNLCVIIDINGLQIDGATEDVLNTEPVDRKMESFGFHVIVLDGNDLKSLDKAFSEAKTIQGQPTCIIAKTVKGKGVSFMENKASWHGKAPNDAEFEQAISEIDAKIVQLGGAN